MRLSDNFVSAEDVKKECNADRIVGYMQIGFGIMLVKKDFWGREKYTGFIDYHCEYLGDDLLITKIEIYDNEEESKRLTDMYKGKILICSHRDDVQ